MDAPYGLDGHYLQHSQVHSRKLKKYSLNDEQKFMLLFFPLSIPHLPSHFLLNNTKPLAMPETCRALSFQTCHSHNWRCLPTAWNLRNSSDASSLGSNTILTGSLPLRIFPIDYYAPCSLSHCTSRTCHTSVTQLYPATVC